ARARQWRADATDPYRGHGIAADVPGGRPRRLAGGRHLVAARPRPWRDRAGGPAQVREGPGSRARAGPAPRHAAAPVPDAGAREDGARGETRPGPCPPGRGPDPRAAPVLP